MRISTTKVLVLFGTRPEAIKLAPVVLALKDSGAFEVVTCSTGQHANMVKPVCEFFGVDIDFDLDVMQPRQTLDHVATAILNRLPEVLHEVRPGLVMVQGDTATAFAGALSAFFHKIPIAHVEAGLRTYDLKSPWPEEGFRAMVGRLADYHFAPTERSHRNLLRENAQGEKLLTGNTVVDAARIALGKIQGLPSLEMALRLGISTTGRKKILFTAHRRESFGEPIERVFAALGQIASQNDVEVLFPVHPNPDVIEPARRILGHHANVRLLEPLAYDEMIFALNACSIVITDSGGLAEEAPTFGKPALILRDTTERPECVECGNALLVGQDPEKIKAFAAELLAGGQMYDSMAGAPNPFGDGQASQRIANFLAGSASALAVAA